MDSIDLMVAAARAADQDAGGRFIAVCDWLACVPQISFRELDAETLLPQALGISPYIDHVEFASGEMPIRHLNEAANLIATGQARICLIAGGEAVRTSSRRNQTSGPGGGTFQAARTASEIRRRYGLIHPVDIYPLYENATRAAWGQTLAEGQAETGLIWSLMSKVAAESEGAWIKSPKMPAEIVEPGVGNRPIAFPYNKLMVANSSVNQGAAFIVCSLATARAQGVPDDRVVYVWAGASAHESEEPLERVAWNRPPEGMRVTLERVLQVNGIDAGDLHYVELYSCFPCVPKMSRRVLGWPAEKPATVHGGLTFGGGPIGNYMSHAVVAMVQALRREGRNGLLFGNGGYCTHNHAIVISRIPPSEDLLGKDYHYQAEANAARGALPPIGDDYMGPVTAETYTVSYDRAGDPSYGVVISLAPDGTRVVAKVDPEDVATVAFLTDGKVEPVGSPGVTQKDGDSLYWRPAL
ncbi:MAG: acetyl-CoA acetyltransferase [Acidimicrobiales bacterium]